MQLLTFYSNFIAVNERSLRQGYIFLGKNVQALEDDYVHKHMDGKKDSACNGLCDQYMHGHWLHDLCNLKWPDRKKAGETWFLFLFFLLLLCPWKTAAFPKPSLYILFFVATARSDCSPGGDAHALLCICSEIQIQGLPRKYQLCCFDWLFESWNVLGLVFWLPAAVRDGDPVALVLSAQSRGWPHGPA